MGRIELEDFPGKDISRIFIAGSVKEAELVENVLNQNGIDYAISLEPYVRLFFGTERNGIAFYVLSGQEALCRELLSSRGLTLGLTTEDET